MNNIKFLLIIAFLCLVLFASGPGNISSGDTAMSLMPVQESLLLNPYHPNDILQAPAELSQSASDNPTDQYTLNVYYVVPSDIAPDPDVLAEIKEASRDMQAWYQTSTGGWTWQFASPDLVEIYEAKNPRMYYKTNGNWWGSLLPEMQANGLPIWSPGIVTAIWAHGAGFWAGGAFGCLGDCGVALLGVELFPQFNNPSFSGGECPDPDGQGVEAFPCTPVGAFAHELGHTLKLIHPLDDPVTAPYASHSLMQTHWNYPDEASTAESPWGFLSTEQQLIQTSPFMKTGIKLQQVYQDRDTAVNLPPLGDPPNVAVGAEVHGSRVHTINNTPETASYFWTFGDYQARDGFAPLHWYQETGSYKIILRAVDAMGMMGTGSATVDIISSDQYEPNDTLEEAASIDDGAFVIAEIDTHNSIPYHQDVDFFTFSGLDNEVVVARADAEYLESFLHPRLCILDGAGVVLACHAEQFVAEVTQDLPESGVYYLKVDATCAEEGFGCQGSYTLTMAKELKKTSIYLPVFLRQVD
jgi:hypothetical protein